MELRAQARIGAETGVNEGRNRPHHLQTRNSSNSIP
jgi:hypothetical protein